MYLQTYSITIHIYSYDCTDISYNNNIIQIFVCTVSSVVFFMCIFSLRVLWCTSLIIVNLLWQPPFGATLVSRYEVSKPSMSLVFFFSESTEHTNLVLLYGRELNQQLTRYRMELCCQWVATIQTHTNTHIYTRREPSKGSATNHQAINDHERQYIPEWPVHQNPIANELQHCTRCVCERVWGGLE